MDGLQLTLFGTPRVRRGGQPLRFDTRKATALLALLAVTGQEHSRNALAAWLWPELERSRARATLRRTLSVAAAVGPALLISREGIALDPQLVECDVTQFRGLTDSADPADWVAAAALVTDDFLAGFAVRDSPAFEDWQLATADALRDRLSQTLGRIVAAAVAQGDLATALAHARRRVEVDPLSEPAHADLIRTTAWSGDRPGALRAYRALVRLLDRELGVPPLPRTVTLHDQIRAGELPEPDATDNPGSTRRPAKPGDARSPVAGQPGGVHGMAGQADASPAVVGRDHELDQLTALWRSTEATGRCCGLAGDPGMGRTALLHEFARRCRTAGATVLLLTGHAAEQPLAFAASAELLRAMQSVRPGLVDELGAAGEPLAVLTGRRLGEVIEQLSLGTTPTTRPSPPGGTAAPATRHSRAGGNLAQSVREPSPHGQYPGSDRSPSGLATPGDLHRLHEAVLTAVESMSDRERPLLLAIDDAHLLDAPSASLLAYLARRPPAGLLLVASWAAGTGGAPLPEAVGEAGGVLTLPPLDLASVTALLTGHELDPKQVLSRTGGVPLLVREYASAGSPAEDADLAGPAGVRGLVAARLDAAPPTTRQLVAAAAVIGVVADPDLLRFACGRDEGETVDAIEDAVARGLLVERADPAGYDLPHDLVRDAALARTSLARLRLLHGRVAEVLIRRHAADPLAAPAGAVAGHLGRAGREAEAGQWYLAAAAESSRLFAHSEALAQLRAALGFGQQPLDVHQAIGETLVRLGRYDEALVALDQAAALAEAEPHRLGLIEHATARIHDRLGDWSLAESHLTAARDLLTADPAQLAGVLAELALVQHRQARDAEALVTAHLAEQAAAHAPDEAAHARVGNVLGLLADAAGDHDQARRHLTIASELARREGDLELQIAALNNLSRSHQHAGDAPSALATARQALALAERQGDRHRLAALHSHLADLLHAAGRETEAVESLKVSAAAFAEVHGSSARPEVWTLTEW